MESTFEAFGATQAASSSPEDLAAFAEAAWWCGKFDESIGLRDWQGSRRRTQRSSRLRRLEVTRRVEEESVGLRPERSYRASLRIWLTSSPMLRSVLFAPIEALALVRIPMGAQEMLVGVLGIDLKDRDEDSRE